MKSVAALALTAALVTPTCASASPAKPAKATWAPRGLYGETTAPSQPKGTVIIIHGGGWLRRAKTDVTDIRDEADRFVRYGWRTVNINYRAGWRSVQDVASWYDRVHKRYPGPVCAYGQSAGAHLALMLAAERPVDCVIGIGAITDLTKVGGTADAALLRREYVRPSFGRRARALSPVTHAQEITAPVLLASSRNDRWAGCTQMRYLQIVRPSTRTYCLPGGSADFVHAPVARMALRREHERERLMLGRALRAHSRGDRGTRPRARMACRSRA